MFVLVIWSLLYVLLDSWFWPYSVFSLTTPCLPNCPSHLLPKFPGPLFPACPSSLFELPGRLPPDLLDPDLVIWSLLYVLLDSWFWPYSVFSLTTPCLTILYLQYLITWILTSAWLTTLFVLSLLKFFHFTVHLGPFPHVHLTLRYSLVVSHGTIELQRAVKPLWYVIHSCICTSGLYLLYHGYN